jgi:hypothetical protein
VAFEAKWFIVEALPIMLAVSIVIVVAGVRVLQVIQRVVCRRLPFGATSDTSLTDVVIGIFITGLFYLYFRTWHHVVGRHPGTSVTQQFSALVGNRFPICDGFSLSCIVPKRELYQAFVAGRPAFTHTHRHPPLRWPH